MGFIDVGISLGIPPEPPTPPTPTYPRIHIELADGITEPIEIGYVVSHTDIDVYYDVDEETSYKLDGETEIPGMLEYFVTADPIINRIPKTTIKAKVTLYTEEGGEVEYEASLDVTTTASATNTANLWVEYQEATDYQKHLTGYKNQPATIALFKVYQYNPETGESTDVTDKAELYGGTGLAPTAIDSLSKPLIYLKVSELTTNPVYINYPASIRYKTVTFTPGENAPEDPWKTSDFQGKSNAEISAYFDVKGTDYYDVESTLSQTQPHSQTIVKNVVMTQPTSVRIKLIYNDIDYDQYYPYTGTYTLVNDNE